MQIWCLRLIFRSCHIQFLLGVFRRLWQRKRHVRSSTQLSTHCIPSMDWYYAAGADRKGPVSEEEFQRLVQQGVVTSQTLVWHEGMANWQPHGGGTPPPMPLRTRRRAEFSARAVDVLFPAAKSSRCPAASIALRASRLPRSGS